MESSWVGGVEVQNETGEGRSDGFGEDSGDRDNKPEISYSLVWACCILSFRSSRKSKDGSVSITCGLSEENLAPERVCFVRT